MKQCIIQFDNGSFYHGWIPVEDAADNKNIKVNNRLLNIHGFINGKVIKAFHNVILDDKDDKIKK